MGFTGLDPVCPPGEGGVPFTPSSSEVGSQVVNNNSRSTRSTTLPFSRHLVHWFVSLTCSQSGHFRSYCDLWGHVPSAEGRGWGLEWRLGDPGTLRAYPPEADQGPCSEWLNWDFTQMVRFQVLVTSVPSLQSLPFPQVWVTEC